MRPAIAVPRRSPRTIAFIPLIEGEGWRVSLVTEHEAGHAPTGDWPCPPGGVRPWFWGTDYDFAVKLAADYNLEKLDVDAAEAGRIVMSSMAQSRRHSLRSDTLDLEGITYVGKQSVTIRLTADGDLLLEGVGYYEDDVIIPETTLRSLGLRRSP